MKPLLSGLDIALIIPVVLLLSFSLLMISSTSANLALQQLIFMVLGIALFLVLSRVDYRYFSGLAALFYFFSLLMLILLPLVGEEIRGSTRWIELSFFRFQPSELAKLSLILVLASFFAKRSLSLKNVFLSSLLVLPIFTLVLRQPDLGNALVIAFIYFLVLFVAGFSNIIIFLGMVFGLLLLPVLFTLLAPYQQSRVITFLDPSHDPLGIGYSVIQSQIAVGSGQLTGRGFGRGTQSHLAFLPERQTDFIFATVSEELGLVGAAILISLFVLLLVHVLDISKMAKDRFATYVAIGIFGWVFFQVAINVGMNVGIFPVTGITLPLISYGGSSLVSLLVSLGVLSSISRAAHS